MRLILYTGQRLEAKRIEFGTNERLILTTRDDDYIVVPCDEVVAIID